MTGAIGLLEQVQHLAHMDKPDFEPLHALQQAAQSLLITLAEGASAPPSLEMLAKVQPFEIVLKMAGAGPHDGEDENAQEVVAALFPRLLFALGAKKIIRSDPAQPHAPSSVPTPQGCKPAQGAAELAISGGSEAIPLTQAHIVLESKAEPAPQTDEALQTEQQEPAEGIDLSGQAETPERQADEPTLVVAAPELQELAPEPAAGEQEYLPPAERAGAEPRPARCVPTSFIIAEETAATFASGMLPTLPSFSPGDLEKISWLALAEGKVSTAYNLALALQMERPDDAYDLSTRFRALALGQNVRTASGPLAELLKQDFSLLANLNEPESEHAALAFRLLLVCSALQPALVAPDTNAKAILALGCQKLPRLNKLYWLCNQVIEYSLPSSSSSAALLSWSAVRWNRDLTSSSSARKYWAVPSSSGITSSVEVAID